MNWDIQKAFKNLAYIDGCLGNPELLKTANQRDVRGLVYEVESQLGARDESSKREHPIKADALIARFFANESPNFRDERDIFPSGVTLALNQEAYFRSDRRMRSMTIKSDQEFSLDEKGDWSYATKFLARMIVNLTRFYL